MVSVLAAIILHFVSEVHASVSPVVINEFVVDSDPEWIELYVSGELDLSSYWIDDDTDFDSDTGSGKKKNLKSAQTESFPYITLEFGSFFNNTGDSVTLFDSTGAIVDTYAYDTNPGKNVSIGRAPDGTGGFSILTSPSKGSANSSIATPTPTITPTPTMTPKPTKTPTPTKTPSPTVTPSPTSNPTQAPTKFFKNPSRTYEPTPRSVLGASRREVEKAVYAEKEPIASASSSQKKQILFIILGSLCFAAAGVSMFIIHRRESQTPEGA